MSQLSEEVAAVDRIPAVRTILDVVCATTGMGFAAIARVTEDRWIACSVLDRINFGLLAGGELDVKTTICDEIRQHTEPVIIDDVGADPVYCGHRTAAMYGFKSYISMPIFRGDGSFFGTLCAIDPSPHVLKRPEVIGMFRPFSELIGYHLDAMLKLKASEAEVARQSHMHDLRDQFISVLGHDLRNPLASIDSGMRLLKREQLSQKALTVATLVEKSVTRMAALISDVLDFARGRLGEGIIVHKTEIADLTPVLQQVIDESLSAVAERSIVADLKIDVPVFCDPGRVGQLLSNLIGNAVAHGDRDAPIQVRAATEAGRFSISVINQGPAIPEERAQHLFQPFSRSKAEGQGLGLGLYICSEIARGHGGAMTSNSEGGETTFTFSMGNSA